MLAIGSVRAKLRRHLEGWILKAAKVVLCLTLTACVFVLVYSYFRLGDRLGYCNWSDRDMVRSARLFEQFQVSGAELSFGGGARLPGGFLHYIWGLPMLFSDSPVVVHRFMLGMNFLGAAVLFLLGTRYFNLYTGLAAAILFLSSRITVAVTHILWNPGFIALFCACFSYCMYKVVVDRRVRFFKWALAALCIGVQMHLSVALLLIPAVVVLGVYRVFPPRREWLLAVGLIVLLLSPYIVVELFNGFGNTALLLAQPQIQQDSGNLFHLSPRWENVAAMAKDHFAPEILPDGVFLLSALGPVLRYALLVIGVAYGSAFVIVHLLRGDAEASLSISDRQRKGLVVSLVMFCLTILYYLWDRQIRLWPGGDSRFVFVAVPAFSICVGGAAGCLWEGLYRRGRYLLSLLVGLIATLGLVYHTEAARLCLRRLNTQQTIYAWGGLVSVTNAIRESTGWSLEEVIGKTVILQCQGPNKWTWQAGWSSAYLLHQAGAEFPGSGLPPGGVLLQDGKARLGENPRISKEFLVKYLPPEFADIEIRRQFDIGPHIFVEYDRASGHCLTGFSVRQVLTKPEEVAFRNRGRLSAGEAMSYEDNDATSLSYLVNLGYDVLLNVILRQDGNVLDVELHSNQLRGYAWNLGFYAWGAVRNLNVVFRDVESSYEKKVTVSEGLIGGHGPYHGGVHTPLRVEDIEVPPGTYDVLVQGELVGNRELWNLLPRNGRAEIALTVGSADDVYHDTLVPSAKGEIVDMLYTGMEVTLSSAGRGLPSPLEQFKRYYLVKISDGVFKLSDSRAGALRKPPKIVDIKSRGRGRMTSFLPFCIPIDRIPIAEREH